MRRIELLQKLRREYVDLYSAKLRHVGDIAGADMLRTLDTTAGDENLKPYDVDRLIGYFSERLHVLKTDPARVISMDGAMEVPDGIYVKGDRVYKLVHAVHATGKQYARIFDPVSRTWVFAGREPLRDITLVDRMTAPQAREFSRTHGVCISCGHTLNPGDEMSPVCVARFT